MSKKKATKQATPEPQNYEQLVTTKTVEPIKMSFFRLALSPFSMFVDNLRPILFLVMIYSAIAAIFSLALGQGYVCNYMSLMPIDFYCQPNVFMLLSNIVIKLFIFAVFTLVYYQHIQNKEPFELKNILLFNRQSLKIFYILLAFFICNILPFIALFLLIIRVPNPHWQQELMFFTINAIGFIMPFIAMHFYAALAIQADGKSPLSLRELWITTSGNGLKIITSLMLIFIFYIFIIFQFYVMFIEQARTGGILTGIISTYLYNFLILSIYALFINHCIVQKQIILGEPQND